MTRFHAPSRFHTAPEAEPITPEMMAGYLLWYCGGRGTAIAYAHAAKRPEVAHVLAKRLETPYDPPASATAHRAPEATP